MKRLWTLLGALALVVGLTACGLQAPERVNIVETLQAEGFDRLVGLVTDVLDADTIAALASDEAGPFTVFAPTDDAIEAFLASGYLPVFGQASADRMLEKGLSFEELAAIVLGYHVLEGRFSPRTLIADGSAVTASGIQLFFDADGPGWVLNKGRQNVAVVGGPIQATNGTIYVIDTVLEPATIADVAILNPGFDVLVAALVADAAAGGGLLAAASNHLAQLTVFAPTDAAFAAALEALDLTAEQLLASSILSPVLQYHIASGVLLAEDVLALIDAGDGSAPVPTLLGQDITASLGVAGVVLDGTVNVVVTDVLAVNGVIHVIDAVLLPDLE